MAWDDLTGKEVTYASSPVETSRFGLSVGRVTVGCDVSDDSWEYQRAKDQLAVVLAEADDDVLVVRYPARAIALGAAIAGTGRDVVPAGALTYWGTEVESILDAGPATTSSDLDVVTARELATQEHTSEDDIGRVLDAVIGDSFAGYANHYLANPLFDRDAALTGYQDWARRSFEGSGDGLVLRHAGKPIGVATCSMSSDGRSHLEILLAGLITAAQGQGRYAVLIHGCATEAHRRGLSRLVISTQVHNTRVQRAWAKLGFRPFAAVETVHAVRRGLLPKASPLGMYGSPGPQA